MNKPFELFKSLGEENRFRIAALLVHAKRELCACEIIAALEKPQYTISKSMSTLAAAGLIEERRDGKMMLYRLKTEDPCVNDLADTIGRMISAKGYIWKTDLAELGSKTPIVS